MASLLQGHLASFPAVGHRASVGWAASLSCPTDPLTQHSLLGRAASVVSRIHEAHPGFSVQLAELRSSLEQREIAGQECLAPGAHSGNHQIMLMQ